MIYKTAFRLSQSSGIALMMITQNSNAIYSDYLFFFEL